MYVILLGADLYTCLSVRGYICSPAPLFSSKRALICSFYVNRNLEVPAYRAQPTRQSSSISELPVSENPAMIRPCGSSRSKPAEWSSFQAFGYGNSFSIYTYRYLEMSMRPCRFRISSWFLAWLGVIEVWLDRLTTYCESFNRSEHMVYTFFRNWIRVGGEGDSFDYLPNSTIVPKTSNLSRPIIGHV